MLCLTRGLNEVIHIGDDIQVMVISIQRHSEKIQVKLGITAPKT